MTPHIHFVSREIVLDFRRGQLLAKDEIKKLLKEIDQDADFWVRQRPKFENLVSEVDPERKRIVLLQELY